MSEGASAHGYHQRDQGRDGMSESTVCVAITGSTGFVGRHVLRHVLEQGHTVRALVRDVAAATADARIHLIKGDLLDRSALAQLVDGAEAVLHLVGIIMECPRRGQTFERVHTQGTRNLLEAARQAKNIGRWIHMSALGTRPDGVSAYHRTKWAAEEAVRDSGLDFTIFRPSIIHGPDGEFMQMVWDFWHKRFPPFVPYFGAGLLGRRGAGRLQPVWVEDVARCFAAALTSRKTVNETYPMGGPDPLTWPQLYEICGRYLPDARKKRIIAVPVWYANLIAGKPGVPFNRDQVVMSQEDSTCQISKVQAEFDFELSPFEETFAEYANQIGQE